MKFNALTSEIGDIPLNWYNENICISSVMEAINFVTPVLEGSSYQIANAK